MQRPFSPECVGGALFKVAASESTFLTQYTCVLDQADSKKVKDFLLTHHLPTSKINKSASHQSLVQQSTHFQLDETTAQ